MKILLITAVAIILGMSAIQAHRYGHQILVGADGGDDHDTYVEKPSSSGSQNGLGGSLRMGNNATISSAIGSKKRSSDHSDSAGISLGRVRRSVFGFFRRVILSSKKKLKHAMNSLQHKKDDNSAVSEVDSDMKISSTKALAVEEETHWISIPFLQILPPSSAHAAQIPVDEEVEPIDDHNSVVVVMLIANTVKKVVFTALQQLRKEIISLHLDYIATTIVVAEVVFDIYFLALILAIILFVMAGGYLSLPILRYVLCGISGYESSSIVSHTAVETGIFDIDIPNMLRSCNDPDEKYRGSQTPYPISTPSPDYIPFSSNSEKVLSSKEAMNVSGKSIKAFDSGLTGLLSQINATRSEAKEEYGDEEESGDKDEDETSQFFMYSGSPSGSSSTGMDAFPVVTPTALGMEGSASLDTASDDMQGNESEGGSSDTYSVEPRREMFEVETVFEALSTKSMNSMASTQVSPSSTPMRTSTTKTFSCVNPFDQNGVLVYLMSAAKAVPVGGKKSSIVRAKMSSIFMGSEQTVIAHTPHDLGLHSFPNYSENEVDSWCAVDLGSGRRLQPTQYCIRHGASSAGNALRNWELRGRERDSAEWDTLMIHNADCALSDEPLSVAIWDIPPVGASPHGDNADNSWNDVSSPPGLGSGRKQRHPVMKGYRYFLLHQTDVNSSGNNCLFIGGLELYGTLTEKGTR